MIFFDESIVDEFLKFVYERFFRDGYQYKIMEYTEIINYQPRETAEAKSNRIWLTNVFTATHFNSYVRSKMGNQIR